MTVLIASAPALPLHKAGPYVAAAYIAFLAVVLVYVAIMAIRLGRNRRDIEELRREVLARPQAGETVPDDPTEHATRR
jgi:hypothetical protein